MRAALHPDLLRDSVGLTWTRDSPHCPGLRSGSLPRMNQGGVQWTGATWVTATQGQTRPRFEEGVTRHAASRRAFVPDLLRHERQELPPSAGLKRLQGDLYLVKTRGLGVEMRAAPRGFGQSGARELRKSFREEGHHHCSRHRASADHGARCRTPR